MFSLTVSSNDLIGKDDVFVRLNPNRDAAAASANHLISTLGIQQAALVCDLSSRSRRIRYTRATTREIYE